jgi:hypothetical protein
VTGIRGRRGTQPPDDLEEKRGYWNSEEETLGRSLWEICVGKKTWTSSTTDCLTIVTKMVILVVYPSSPQIGYKKWQLVREMRKKV